MKLNVKRHAVVQPQDQSIRLIPLTQGHNAIVDAADYEWLMQWNWRASFDHHTKSFYARHDNVFMHLIICRREGRQTDHENGDTLDNRRKNLRPCTSKQNSRNSKKPCTNTSGYKGVFRRSGDGWWEAKIRVDGRYIWLGRSLDKVRLAQLYDTAAVRYFGPFARLNFPHMEPTKTQAPGHPQ